MYAASPGLHIKFHDSENCTEKYYSEKLKRCSQNNIPKKAKLKGHHRKLHSIWQLTVIEQ